MNFDLYYYKRTDEGYSLRITPLGLAFMLIALVIGFAILFSSMPSREKPNINISTQPPPARSQNQRLIEAAPVSPTTHQGNRRTGALVNKQSDIQIERNTNER
jgi:hypothetical protein